MCKIVIFFLIHQFKHVFWNTRWDGSFEHPQHMFWLRNKKNNFQLHTLIWGSEILNILGPWLDRVSYKVSFKPVSLATFIGGALMRYQQMQWGTNRYNEVQTDAMRYQQMQWGPNRCSEVQTDTVRYQQMQWGTNSCSGVPTDSV